MNQLRIEEVWKKAGNRCEYYRIPQAHFRLPFQIDHIIARQHGGPSAIGNLALACMHCNRFKGPNIAGLDPVSGELVRLFHPRTDIWDRHFQFDGARIEGTTPVGRATVQVLAMNAPDLLLVRLELIREGIFLA